MLISPRRHTSSSPRFLLNRAISLSMFLLVVATVTRAQSSAIAYVQSNSADPQIPQSTVTVPYAAAQTAGNLNVVIVGWNDSTARVLTVADTRGNAYVLAVGPTVQTGTATQAIYYAKNIAGAAANANTVTVTFSTAAVFPDIRIAEYSGLDLLNPLDVSIGAQGSSATSNSGAVTTTNANDLLVGANLVQTSSTGPGTSFTNRVITFPDGDILEDRVVTATGSYSATAPLFSGSWIMQLVAFRAAGGSGGTAQSIAATAGTPQSATVNTAFATALQATVKDSLSNPVSGVNVTFTAPGSGASGVFSNSTATIVVATNASGVASAPFTANATAGGAYTVTAAASGLTTVNFSLTNTAVPPSTMTANAGTTPQSATISTAFANALAVTVKDAGGNPVSGVNVTFTAPGSGASGVFSNSTATIVVATNASGVASAPFTANATAGGAYTVTATASGLTTVNFSLTNTAGAPTTMMANAGTTPQSAAVSTVFASALAVMVKDAGSNPVSGVNVTFTAPGSGASGTFSNSTTTITVTTNATGVASAPFTANATVGGPYTVTATASGLTTVNFSLTNTAGAPTTMTANAGTTPQSATISTAFANALAVTVKDAGSNPVSGVNVTFTAPGSGASGVFSNSTATIVVATNASGVASAPFTANATAGGAYTVTAAASGLTTVNFSLNNLSAGGPITLVQHTSKDAGTTTSSTLAFASSNTAGNFIAVVIRAGKAGQVFTVTDSRGNTYRKPMQFSETVDGTTLGILYAENIAGGPNTITVSDSISGTMRFAILEYSGVATANSLDGVAVASQGTSASPNSGNLTTTASGELVLAGMSTANGASFTVGSGYLARDFVPAEPNTKLLVEDRIQSVAGNISANASLGATDNWGAVAAAFKSGTTVPPPTFTPPSNLTATASGPVQVNLSWTAATETGGTLTGYLIERCTGSSCANFAQIGSSATTTYSDTSASLTGSTTYNYRVRATDGTNFSGYSNTASATTAAPTFAAPSNLAGTPAGSAQLNLSWTAATETGGTITTYLVERCAGANCANTPSNFAQVGSPVTTSFSDTGLTVSTPYSYRVRATDGTNFSSYSNVATATPVLGPTLSTLGLTQGPVGASITITGSSFGGSRGSSTITFNGTPVTTVASWSDNSIDTSVPAGATTGSVVVTVGGAPSNGLLFTVTPPPNILNISPISGPIGTLVTINGTNFGPTVGTRVSGVTFNGVAARTNNWSDTQILVPVPVAATSGNVLVSVGGVPSNAINFTVTALPTVSTLSPASGPVGTSISITGTNFGSTQGTSTVTFNGLATTPTVWNDTNISAPVPAGASTGNVVVTVGGQASNGVIFTVTSSGAPIAFIQVNSALPHPSATTVTIPYTAPQNAGDLNVVVVGWNDSIAHVNSVADTSGNVYTLAVGPTVQAGLATQSIYYAKGIASAAANANAVTVTFSSAANSPDIRIAEYSNVDPVNAFDASAAAQGSSALSSSGNVTSTSAGDLLVGANLVQTFTTGPGAGFTSRVITSPDGDILEDQLAATAGSYSATAPNSPAGSWIMQVVAFRAGNGAPPLPITVSVAPPTASVTSGGAGQGFVATLQNDVQSKGVTWSLSGAGCAGNTCGTLSAISATTVTYSAPPVLPSPPTVTLKATSAADNTKTATATITVTQGTLSVAIAPALAAVTLSQSQQFTATVFNDPQSLGVTWMVDGNNGGNTTTGTVSTSGLFTPGTQAGQHTVTAVSVSNASVTATATAAVTDLAGVLTYHNDVARTGQNLKEYALSPSTVSSSTFGRLFSCPVDGYLYAQPLYVANLTIASVTRNVVILATEHDSVYAFDADSPSCTQLWKVSFLGTGVTTMSYLDTNGTDDVFPEIGITSTPVVDLATNTIYVEAKTKETVGSGCSAGSPCFVHRLHALDLLTGLEKFGGPVVISAPNFVSQRHFNRPGLLLANGTVYVAFGSHGDVPPWYGWLFGYDQTTLAQKFVFATSDAASGSSKGASIWDGGAGPAADASGNVYATTGNGAYDGTKNFSESTLKISPSGALLDWFTPFNQALFDSNDVDLGSAGVVILPDSVGSAAHPHLALATGKIAILFLLDQNNMGKFHSLSNADVQEVIPVPPPNTTQLDGGNYGVPAYWNGNIYTTGQNYPLSQFKIANGNIATPQFAVSANRFPPRGATPAVSASGATNGIVWVLDLSGWPTSGNTILDAYDASNVSNLLFSSPSSGSGAAGPAVKFTVPTVANGKVYVGGQGVLSVFGLLP
jgi:hypothetical protein